MVTGSTTVTVYLSVVVECGLKIVVLAVCRSCETFEPSDCKHSNNGLGALLSDHCTEVLTCNCA